jgi:hypothetical protein
MKSNTQNAKIKAITEKTLIIGIDVGSETHYARAFDWRGYEFSKTPLAFSNTEEGFETFRTWIGELKDVPKTEFFKAVAERMDREIHRGYELFPCNYIALDELNGNTDNASHYTDADKLRFEKYLSGQIAKISIPNKDEAFLRERILTMYANPVRNYLRVKK